MIWSLNKANMSYEQIKQILKVGNDRISHSSNMVLHNHSPAPTKMGRLPKINDELIARIETLTQENAHLGEEKLLSSFLEKSDSVWLQYKSKIK